MKRRDFISLVGSAAALPVLLPRVARAQQPAAGTAVPVIGYLGGPSPEDMPLRFAGLRQGLKEAGLVEGQNVAIEYRATEDRYDRFPEFAFDLVRRPVNAIFASEKDASLAAKRATKAIPIVFALGGDPIFIRLVASLSRPGGNVTGVSFEYAPIIAKQLELLRATAPRATAIGVLINQANASAAMDAIKLQRAAPGLGLQMLILDVSNKRQLDAAFAALIDRKIGGLIVEGDPFFSERQNEIVALAASQGIPAIFADPENAAGGALMTYALSIAEAFRLAGNYLGRILKGEKPADLPVQQSTKTVFTINLKTAKALALSVPQTLIAAADKVIE